MNGCTTARQHVARLFGSLCRLGHPAVVPSCIAVLVTCAPPTRYQTRSELRHYQIVVSGRDSLSRELARALRERGFRVRNAVKGGGPPTVYLLAFTHREGSLEQGANANSWLHLRFADTRTGAIVAAVSVPIPSLGGSVDAQARSLLDSLGGGSSHRPPD